MLAETWELTPGLSQPSLSMRTLWQGFQLSQYHPLWRSPSPLAPAVETTTSAFGKTDLKSTSSVNILTQRFPGLFEDGTHLRNYRLLQRSPLLP